jgi:hypothetical protein
MPERTTALDRRALPRQAPEVLTFLTACDRLGLPGSRDHVTPELLRNRGQSRAILSAAPDIG